MKDSAPAHMSPTEIGRTAETRSANFLANNGFTVLDRNWRNRWCELDIVAKKSDRIHFVEVKYRRTTAWGMPSEYISRDKAARLIRAASAWNQAHGYRGPYQIDLVSVTGSLDQPAIEIIENIIEA